MEGLSKDEHRTRERPTSNVEWKKMKKKTYDLEERLLENAVRIINNEILLQSGATSFFDVQRWAFDADTPPLEDSTFIF